MNYSFLFLTALTAILSGSTSAANNLYFDAPDECMTKDYQLSLFTNSGIPIGLAAIPFDQIENCPMIGMHAYFGPGMEEPQRLWLKLEESDLAKSHSVNTDLHTLTDIEGAYLNGELRAKDITAYDPISNNDSHFPLSILSLLGVQMLSSDLVAWAKEMVMDRMDDLKPSLETSPNMSMIMADGGRRLLKRVLSEDTMAEMLVMHCIQSMGMGMQ